MIKRFFSLVLLATSYFILISSLSSCSLLSTFSAGPAQKEGMLSARLDKFTRAMYFESISELSDYIEPAYRAKYFKAYSRRGDYKDFVESDVKSLDFYNESNNAVALVRTKILEKSSLHVKNNYHKLDWSFSSTEGGWRLQNLTEMDEDVFLNLSKE